MTLPMPEVEGIGTYFNRAVVSSQAFARKFGGISREQIAARALPWLANGLERAIPEFLRGSSAIRGAIYHLEDRHWVIPAIRRFRGPFSLVFNQTSKDRSNDGIVAELAASQRSFHRRTRASIMHNKFLVRTAPDGTPESVLTGSANFTTAGLTYAVDEARLPDVLENVIG